MIIPIAATTLALIVVSHPKPADPLLAAIRRDLKSYGNYNWNVHRLVDHEKQVLVIDRLDAKGIGLTLRLADSFGKTLPFNWQAKRTWSSTWRQLTSVKVDGKLPAGNAVIWLTSERQTPKGPIDLFCDFSILNPDTAQQIADELRHAAAKFATR